jgi:hypothetical protein
MSVRSITKLRIPLPKQRERVIPDKKKKAQVKRKNLKALYLRGGEVE